MKNQGVKNKPSKHRIKVALALGLVKLLSYCSLGFIQGLGYGVGYLFASLPSPFKKVAQINVQICFPEKDERWRKRVVRMSIINTTVAAFEYAAHWFWPVEKIRGYIQEPDSAMKEAFYAIRDKGQGIIMLSPHMGAWESLLGFLPERIDRITMMYRPLRIKALEETVRNARERAGAHLVPATAGGIRTMIKALKNGEVVGLLPDQVPTLKAGVIAPLFGEPALTMTLAAKLAQKTNAKVIIGYSKRLGLGEGFHPEGEFVSDGIYNSDKVLAATAMNQAIEKLIRKNPEQYVWGYKRFKRRGTEYKKIY